MLHLAVVSLLKKKCCMLFQILMFLQIFHYHIEQVRLYLASHQKRKIINFPENLPFLVRTCGVPTIKNVMRNLTLNPGERALFRCKVDMKCMVSYIQWYHEMTNGQLLLSFEKSEITWKMCSFKYGEKNTTILSPRISCYPAQNDILNLYFICRKCEAATHWSNGRNSIQLHDKQGQSRI